MEHVRLPLLVSTPQILNNVIEEPLLKNSPKCMFLYLISLHDKCIYSINCH